MIRFTTEEGKPTCIAELGDRVAVYLDNDSLVALSKGSSSLRDRFVAAIRKRGTLLFSFANAIELSGPQGASAAAVWSFLDRIGPHWVPLALSPWKVAEREKAGLGGRAPVSERFIESYFNDRAYELSPEGSRVLDLSADTFLRLSAVAAWAQEYREQTRKDAVAIDEALRKRVIEERAAYNANPQSLDQSLPRLRFDERQPATFVLIHLLRILVIEAKAFQLKAHDGLDFCHAVLAAAYAHVATLDRHWKRRVERLPTPHRLAVVYYRPQLTDFVESIEGLVA